MSLRFVAVVPALWLLASGCDADEDNDSGNAYPARFASTWCELQTRCCQEAGGSPEDGCKAAYESLYAQGSQEAEASGAIFDDAAAERCLNALREFDCALGDRVLQEQVLNRVCSYIWKGVVPPGGACRDRVSCALPEVSDGASAEVFCSGSTCVQTVYQPVGGSCAPTCASSPCYTRTDCDPAVAICDGDICVAAPPLPNEGEACTASCAEGLFCGGGVCVPLLATGETCTYDGECRSGPCHQRCEGNTCHLECWPVVAYCALP